VTNDKATAAGSGQASLPHVGEPGDQRLRVQVANQVVAGIGSGRYEGRVPPEAELSARLGVGRKTVARALAELRQCGPVRYIRGSGNLVLPAEPEPVQP
jgi:DNA-binding GntR family transcriptional regulator